MAKKNLREGGNLSEFLQENKKYCADKKDNAETSHGILYRAIMFSEKCADQRAQQMRQQRQRYKKERFVQRRETVN